MLYMDSNAYCFWKSAIHLKLYIIIIRNEIWLLLPVSMVALCIKEVKYLLLTVFFLQ